MIPQSYSHINVYGRKKTDNIGGSDEVEVTKYLNATVYENAYIHADYEMKITLKGT